MSKPSRPSAKQPAPPAPGFRGADRYLDALLPLLVFAAPLILCFQMHDTFDLPKLTLLYAGVCVGWAAWLALTPVPLRPRSSSLLLPVILFLLVAWISALCSIEMPMSVFGSYRVYVFGALPLTMLGALVALTWQAASPKLLRSVAWMALLSGAIVGLYAFFQFAGMEVFDAMPLVAGGRPWSTLGNPVYLGALCMMALPVGIGVWCDRKGVSQFWTLVFFIAASVGLLLSLSRGAWVGAGVGGGLSMALLVRGDAKRLPAFRKFSGFVFIGVVIAGFLLPVARQRVATLLSTREGSNAARLEGWKAAVAGWREKPWLGSGPDTFVRTFRRHRSLDYIRAAGTGMTQAHVHNDFLQFASTEGTLGVLAYLALLLGAGRIFWKRSREGRLSPIECGLVGALAALCVQNQFNFSSLATSIWSAVFLGLLSAAKPAEDEVLRAATTSPGRRATCVAAAIAGLWWISRPAYAEWSFSTGQRLQSEGKSFEAFRAIDRAIWLAPSNGVYKTERANMLRTMATKVEGTTRRSLLGNALVTAETVTAEHPSDPDAWNNLGVAAMWMTQLGGVDRMAAAEKAFREALTIDPVFVDAWANLAKWQHLSGHLDEEDRLWQKVLTLDPSHAMARQVLTQHGKAP